MADFRELVGGLLTPFKAMPKDRQPQVDVSGIQATAEAQRAVGEENKLFSAVKGAMDYINPFPQEAEQMMQERFAESEQDMGELARLLYLGGGDVFMPPMTGLMMGSRAVGAGAKMKVGGKNVARREVAERLKGMGADDEVIWRKTGWRSDPKGNWAFEVDDSKMGFLIDNKRLQAFGPDDVMPLDEVIKHDELFVQYPQLRDVNVEVGYGTGASYSEISNTITIGDAHFRGGYKGKTVREDLIHEIQHAIQKFEDWPKGGTPKPSYNPVWDDKLGWTHPGKEQAWKDYMNLWGEFQSRDAASRATWGPAERKLVRPYSSEFEPEGGWIFR